MATQALDKDNGASGTPKAVATRPVDLGYRAWDPFKTLEAFRQIVVPWLEMPMLREFSAETAPAVNLYERDGTYVLECAVPGYSKDDIKLEARGDEVRISGSYEHEKSEGKNHYHRREIRQGSFSRMVSLPQAVDSDKVSAKLENGVLTVTLQPTKAIESKSIPISG